MKNTQMRNNPLLLFSFFLYPFSFLFGQDSSMHNVKMMDMNMPDMTEDTSMFMPSAYSLHLPMTTDGSGTSWLPSASPMNAVMWNKKTTQIMLHGAVFVRGDFQNINNPNARGHGYQFDAPNWIMVMVNQKMGKKGLLTFHVMMSLDRLTEGGSGYPLVFQTGESWQGKALIDRQHPHDLFAQISVAYTYAFTKDLDLSAYFGFPGEPAIGPSVFMHRPSAMYLPDAPIAHHWQDATHITFGVGTIGFRYKIMKVEGSIFTGREPDENRFDFDRPRFDSYSGRLSVNPDKHISIQASYAFIKSPEALDPTINVNRITSSVIYALNFKKKQSINATMVWGINITPEHKESAILTEGTYQIDKFAAFGRYEWVQKDESELQISTSARVIHDVHALTAGAAYNFITFYHVALVIGAQSTVNFMDQSLHILYGKAPISAEVYLQIKTSSLMGLHHQKAIKHDMKGMDM